MPRISVVLDKAYCADTEDVTGADHLYFAGAGRAKTRDGKIIEEGFTTRPTRINDGQYGSIVRIDKNTGNVISGGTVFEQDLPSGCFFDFGMTANDQDASSDVGKLQAVTRTIERDIARYPYAPIASVVFTVVNSFFALDGDDTLGVASLRDFEPTAPISVDQMPYGWKHHVWDFKEGGIGWSTWSYRLYFRIGKL